MSVRYSIFLDLKNAFDKANKTVILSELAKIISGTLLTLIKDYMTGRKGQVYLEGTRSKVKDRELGTPQGGVLSPTLFNVLMNALATIELPCNCQLVIYADDILLQALESKCEELGIVISTEKSKVYTDRKIRTNLFTQGI